MEKILLELEGCDYDSKPSHKFYIHLNLEVDLNAGVCVVVAVESEKLHHNQHKEQNNAQKKKYRQNLNFP